MNRARYEHGYWGCEFRKPNGPNYGGGPLCSGGEMGGEEEEYTGGLGRGLRMGRLKSCERKQFFTVRSTEALEGEQKMRDRRKLFQCVCAFRIT